MLELIGSLTNCTSGFWSSFLVASTELGFFAGGDVSDRRREEFGGFAGAKFTLVVAGDLQAEQVSAGPAIGSLGRLHDKSSFREKPRPFRGAGFLVRASD